MLNEDWDPLVVQLLDVSKGEPISIAGDDSDRFVTQLTADENFDEGELEASPDVFKQAGFDRLLLSGDPEQLAAPLLDYLRLFDA
jgi:hypothetical protein